MTLNMAQKFYKTEKFQKVFYMSLYFLCVVTFILSGAFIFYRTYFSNVYVSGASMSPTLVGGAGGRCHYGISDNHRIAIDNLKRFDVVITYYPNSWVHGDEDTTYKIKRVWGFPGETISMSFTDNHYTFTVTNTKTSEVIYSINAPVSTKEYETVGTYTVATFETKYRTFDTHVANGGTYYRQNFTVSLDETKKEYFVMGDNWVSSSDSYYHINQSEKLSYDNLQGRVVAIRGTAVVVNGELTDKKPIYNMYYF